MGLGHSNEPPMTRRFQFNLAISWCVLRTRAAIVRGATKDPFTAWQRDCSAIHVVRSVLGLEAVHRDRVSRLQRILSPTLSAKAVRGATLNCIIRYLAALVFHVDIVVDVRI